MRYDCFGIAKLQGDISNISWKKKNEVQERMECVSDQQAWRRYCPRRSCFAG